MNGAVAPTALVSWAHRDEGWSDLQAEEWIEKVIHFATLLMSNGVVVSLDLWSETDPTIDWTRWGQRQVQDCDLVIILASAAWRERWGGTNSPHRGAGVVSEADTLKGLFNEDQGAFQRKALLVLLPGMGAEAIPSDLHRLQRFCIESLDARGIEPLLRRIHGRPLHARPTPKGPPDLPPRSFVGADSGVASRPIAAKRGELDEIRSGDPDAAADVNTPRHGVSFSKPPLGKVPPKHALWKKVTLGGIVAFAIGFAAFANNASGAVKNVCDISRLPFCSTSTPSPTPSIVPSPDDATPKPTLPAETSPEKLASTYDGTDPSGCAAAGHTTMNTLEIKRVGTNDLLATVEIKHALKCDTTWVRVINTMEGVTIDKVLERRAGDGLPAYKKSEPEPSGNFAVAGNNTSFSSQAYAPGCVTASVQIIDASGALAGELPPRDFCWTAPLN